MKRGGKAKSVTSSGDLSDAEKQKIGVPSAMLAPAGFSMSGVVCGLKASGKPDLSLFVCDRPAAAAGVFTQNEICGAPVIVSRRRVPSNAIRAIVINSGNSNACTGETGLENAQWMTAEAARHIGCDESTVLVCSTGVIGQQLRRTPLKKGISTAYRNLDSSEEALQDAAGAIMTTDTFPKIASRTVQLKEGEIRLTGVAKGAAMIAPNMATMLCVVMTDASLASKQCQRMLSDAVTKTFNRISVDGHESTSDTVLMLASGSTDQLVVSRQDLRVFEAALLEVCGDLARMIIRDAEGASHFITIRVSGMRNEHDAELIARAIADSPLVKTAIAGCDPNWGRIVSAAGYSGVRLANTPLELRLNGTLIYQNGEPTSFDGKKLSASMRNDREVLIELEGSLEDGGVEFWTCDLTQEYVRLNSEYTT